MLQVLHVNKIPELHTKLNSSQIVNETDLKIDSTLISSTKPLNTIINVKSHLPDGSRRRAHSDPPADLEVVEDLNIPTHRAKSDENINDKYDTSDPEFDAIIVDKVSPVRETSNPQFPAPLNASSSILSHTHADMLLPYLPIILQYDKWELLYSVLLNGADISTFYSKTKGCGSTLIVIQTDENEIFGGFVCDEWKIQKTNMFYGSGESFLFRACKDNICMFI
jgi:hypothetical protein